MTKLQLIIVIYCMLNHTLAKKDNEIVLPTLEEVYQLATQSTSLGLPVDKRIIILGSTKLTNDLVAEELIPSYENRMASTVMENGKICFCTYVYSVI